MRMDWRGGLKQRGNRSTKTHSRNTWKRLHYNRNLRGRTGPAKSSCARRSGFPSARSSPGRLGCWSGTASCARRCKKNYRYILLDEFQDTKIRQLGWLGLLAAPTRNILALGDADQAIYRFRGAWLGGLSLFL